MLNNSIYSDNLQRTYIVGMIQERINLLEIRLTKYSNKKCIDYKNDIKELNSLKDFLLFNS
mgnify:CR=1 FL=1